MSESVKERIKQVRKVLKLSQKEISERIGIARTYWTSLENGNRDITGKILMSLLVTFDISADWLLTGKNSMFSHYNVDDPYLIDFEKESDLYYLSIVAVVELMETLTGQSPHLQYDTYLKEVVDVVHLIRKGPKKTRNLNFAKLSDALSKDLRELVHEYFLLTSQSERIRKLKASSFEPPRHFKQVKLDLVK